MSLLTMSVMSILFAILIVIGILMSNKSWRIALCTIGAVALLIVGVAGFGAHASDNYEFVMIER